MEGEQRRAPLRRRRALSQERFPAAAASLTHNRTIRRSTVHKWFAMSTRRQPRRERTRLVRGAIDPPGPGVNRVSPHRQPPRSRQHASAGPALAGSAAFHRSHRDYEWRSVIPDHHARETVAWLQPGLTRLCAMRPTPERWSSGVDSSSVSLQTRRWPRTREHSLSAGPLVHRSAS